MDLDEATSSVDESFILPSAPHPHHASQPDHDRATTPTTLSSPPADTPSTPPAFTGKSALAAWADNGKDHPKSRQAAVTERVECILKAVKDGDLAKVKTLAAEPGGYLTAEARRHAWPFLLGCTGPDDEGAKPQPEVDSCSTPSEPQRHSDENQVRLDVNRSFVSYPKDISADEKERLRNDLEEVIVHTLRQHPALSYFQGYHDIISVLLLTFDNQQLSIRAAQRMSLHKIRDNMGTGLEPVLGYLKLLHRILGKANPQLYDVVSIAASIPYFSLSWVLTLMSHDLTSLDVTARLFDFLLAHNPAMVSYFGVALILLKSQELASLDEDSIEDPAILHHTLSKLPPIVLSLPPSEPASPTTPLAPSDDEDLMSTSTAEKPSPSSFTASSASTSSLSDSYTSSLFTTSTDSLSALSESMFSDPDITGLAFDSPVRTPVPNSIPQTASQRPTPPPLLPWQIPISIEDLITRSLELYELYPLLGDNGIGADEIMGPKSCVFTWPLSVEGRLDDEGAEDIARRGVDIVLPEVLPEVGKEKVPEAMVGAAGRGGKKEQRRKRRERTKLEYGMGAALIGVGVAVLVAAVYSGDVRSTREKLMGRWSWSA